MDNGSPRNLADVFHQSARRFGHKTLYMSKRDGKYRALTYGQVHEIVCNLALGMASLGIKKDDKVAILCPTQEEWAMSDFAILSLGAVTVPIYPNLPTPQVEYILQNSDARLVVASDREQLAKIIECKNQCPMLNNAVLITHEDKHKDYVLFFSELQELGKKFGTENPGYIEKQIDSIDPKGLATIIYTSGTTGMPKGVMLSHNNILSNSLAAVKVATVGETDTMLSFLPLAHSFERMAGHFMPVIRGCAIAYAESIEKVPQNMGEINPTVMTAVPRLYEKMYDRVKEGLSTAPPIRRKIFEWALGVGKSAYETGERGFKYKIAEKLVFSKLHHRLGGRLRFFVSGGAPLAKEIAEFFAYMGVMILEGYGLTETSPVITVNRPEKVKFGAVGPAIDGVEVRIAQDGEVLTRGPHVMMGYYKNEEATREMIDSDGWLHTGDIGFLDSDNHLHITDRKKNIIVTSGGKNIAPQPIENTLITIPFVEQALVIGDRRNFISALIVPKRERLRDWAMQHGIKFDSEEELLENKEVYAMIDKLIQEAQDKAGFARYEKVRKFALLPKAFSIESGELTPKLSIKRHVVTKNFKDMIDTIYNRETERMTEGDSLT
ncbi:MAG TPA: AMP-dependent synthetase/ligase [bacterium]|nr:AMP-dependent synthetase/ligase [bacterium]HMZ03444.1 AMP-dependent synthetase/ligase [bacterium]HNB07954.1 AMP-dependent synthetase/ligase [bacterium]HNC47573.1 AMP-dependent synthetase/ligase [bacterium]HND76972.1 AMP-dependent synthetase/ligase [bacterium]